jgi:hypothetical protein
VAESRQTLRSVVPSGYLLRALGPRPVGAPEQSVWLEGAHAVDRFRRDWGITTTEHALGVDGGPAALAGLPARRLADHLGVQRTLDGVALRLGRSRPERQHEQDRALGRDLG